MNNISNIKGNANVLLPINGSLGDYISHLVSAIILVDGIATFIYLIIGATKWVSSGGSKDKVQEAKDQITNAIIGLAVVASAWAIYHIIDYFFGIGLIK